MIKNDNPIEAIRAGGTAATARRGYAIRLAEETGAIVWIEDGRYVVGMHRDGRDSEAPLCDLEAMEAMRFCEECELEMFADEAGPVCVDCEENAEFDGLSDHDERMHERRQMGLSDF